MSDVAPDLRVWGLKNVSRDNWIINVAGGMVQNVEPGRNVTLAAGAGIQLGKTEGEIRL